MKPHKSIQNNISVGMLLISTAMIIAFMVIAGLYSYKVMLTSATQTASKELTFAENNIDNLRSIIENYAVILATDETIQKVISSSKEPDDQTLSINEILLRAQMNNIIGTFPRVNAVLLCDKWGNIYDTGVTVLSPETLLSEMSDKQGWKNTYLAPYRISIPAEYARPNVISYTQQINDYRSGAFCGYLTIYVDEVYLRSAYSTTNITNQVIFMQSYEDVIVSGNTNLYDKSKWKTEDFINDTGVKRIKDEYVCYANYLPLQCYLVYQVQRAIIESAINRMLLFMIMIGLCLICITILLSRSISARICKNISTLADAISEIHDGNWDTPIDISADDEVGLLSRQFKEMFLEIRSTTDRLVSEQRQKREMQLELLNQQINPHFLYNTLDTICALIELDLKDEATRLVNNFADFYRGVLSKGSVIISLREEIKIAESYLNIMQTRYHGAFSYSIDVPESLRDNTVLRLTLQPILENAIVHGFEDYIEGGVLNITANESGDEVLLIITDNGKGMPAEQISLLFENNNAVSHSGGYAMRNIYDRIQLYYGQQYGFAVQSTENVGTKVVVNIPHRRWRNELS